MRERGDRTPYGAASKAITGWTGWPSQQPARGRATEDEAVRQKLQEMGEGGLCLPLHQVMSGCLNGGLTWADFWTLYTGQLFADNMKIHKKINLKLLGVILYVRYHRKLNWLTRIRVRFATGVGIYSFPLNSRRFWVPECVSGRWLPKHCTLLFDSNGVWKKYS